jgi:hypothetical protein
VRSWPRVLPCRNPGCEGKGIALLSKGDPYLLIRWPSARGIFNYQCRGCWPQGARGEISSAEFYALPPLGPNELFAIGGQALVERFTRDYTLGGELTPDQGIDLFGAGLHVEDVLSLDPPPLPSLTAPTDTP